MSPATVRVLMRTASSGKESADAVEDKRSAREGQAVRLRRLGGEALASRSAASVAGRLGGPEAGDRDADRGRRSEAVALAAAHRPAAASASRCTVPSSSGTGTQTFRPGSAVGRDAPARRRAATEPRGARRSGGWPRRRSPLRALGREQVDHDALEHVAHPARAQALAALDARHGGGVAGEEGQPQVGTQALRHRAHDGPARPPAGDARRQGGGPGHRAGVVVLDSSALGWRSRTARSARARGSSRAAPVGFWARGVRMTAVRPGRRARASASGSGPESSTAIGSATRPRAGTRSRTPAVARVLDGHAIAGPEVRLEHALDAVQGAAHDGEGPGGDAVGRELPRGESAAARAGGWAPP